MKETKTQKLMDRVIYFVFAQYIDYKLPKKRNKEFFTPLHAAFDCQLIYNYKEKKQRSLVIISVYIIFIYIL